MKLTLCILLAVTALALVCGEESSSTSKLAKHPKHDLFREFKKKFGKKYQETSGVDTEHDIRFAKFLRNLAKMDNMNLNSTDGDDKAQFGITQYSDLSDEEFKSKLLTLKRKSPSQKRQYLTSATNLQANTLVSAQTWNWCDKISGGCVIKDQGQCGSCWAHATTTATEAAVALATNSPIVQLSQQQLIDCDTNYGGCNGGDVAFDYIEKNGIRSLANYPATSSSTGNDGTCSGTSPQFYKLYDWGQYTASTSEELLSQAVAGNGPFVVYVDATNWNSYQGGIMTAAQCAGTQQNHAVTVVGFNKNERSWLIQNSWGTSWGEKGFIRLEFGTNACLFELGGVALPQKTVAPTPTPTLTPVAQPTPTPVYQPTPTPTPTPTPVDQPISSSLKPWSNGGSWKWAQASTDQTYDSTSPNAPLSDAAYLGIGVAVGAVVAALVTLVIVAIVKARATSYV